MPPAEPFPLHAAVARNETHLIQQYIDAGVDLNSFDDGGGPPLLDAVFCSFGDAVRLLLAGGADPSLCGKHGFSPLLVAAEHNAVAIGIMLVKAGAYIDAIREGEGCGTAFCVAARRGHTAFVSFLLEAGADFEKRAAGGFQPLLDCAGAGHTDIIDMLISSGARINARGFEDLTALHIAAGKGNCEVALNLIENGALVDLLDMHGDSPMHHGASAGHPDVVKALISAGSNVNAKNTKLQTPLHQASRDGHHTCVYSLLCAGADVTARDSNGLNALHYAALTDEIEVIEVLLSAGANIRTVADREQTPLVYACIGGSARAANLLLDAGSDIHKLSTHGRGALCTCSNAKVAKVMLDRGASATHVDMNGMSILHWAAYKGHDAGVVCAFYKAGANIFLLDNSGCTAAQVARLHGHEKTAAMLDLLEAKQRALEVATPPVN